VSPACAVLAFQQLFGPDQPEFLQQRQMREAGDRSSVRSARAAPRHGRVLDAHGGDNA
jgi:hypothetical protein